LEIAGGSVETLPSIEDQRAPDLKAYFDKYYVGATGTAEERIRVFRFIRDLAASEYAGWWDVEIIHGSGSPAAEWLQIYREYDLAGVTRHVESLIAGDI
jgi:4-hydroxybutyryl-CoA dehydratase/vinylacetyl-CoA-Delta-isomerase